MPISKNSKNLTTIPNTSIPRSLGDRRYWGEVTQTALVTALAEIKAKHQGPIVVITESADEALRLQETFPFFMSESEPKTEQQAGITHFPDWETLPYDHFSPHQDIISQRIFALHQLRNSNNVLLSCSLTTALHRLPPTHYIGGNSFTVKVGQHFPLETETQKLIKLGYKRVDTVFEHGEFAQRGAIIDVYPMGATLPIRIELFDDEIETLRFFDPDTQRTAKPFEELELLPAREYPFDETSINQFKRNFRTEFDVDFLKCPLYQDVSSGLASLGIEYYLPLFFDALSCLFDYLPANTLILLSGDIQTLSQQFLNDTTERYEQLKHNTRHPIFPPNKLYLTEPEFFTELNRFARVFISHDHRYQNKPGYTGFTKYVPPELTINSRSQEPLENLSRFLINAKTDQQRVLLTVDSTGRRETLKELLAKYKLTPQVVSSWQGFLNAEADFCLGVCLVQQGTHFGSVGLHLIIEGQLFGQRVSQRRRRNRNTDKASEDSFRDITELKLGAPVVHLEHGVGRYQGLTSLTIGDQTDEFLLLEYANDAKLYVPIASLDLIARFSGQSEEHAPLHSLGSDQWQKEKRKAIEKIHDSAAELLNIYARRAAKPGFAHKIDESEFLLFSESFPFEETPDQLSAIEAVTADLKANQPMDRLICGDVGFGKTEVAMRAAFIVLQSNKQVAVLVPTTLLAEQHFQSFADRFADWPFHIEALSRFKTAKEQKQILLDAKAGKIDILIGTHKLLQDSVQFHDLGLIIIDEEHRFGVKHKEKLASLRSEVDILNLTATPIPRTLNQAMAGIRDISIIATAPEKRLSIKTFVQEYKSDIVKEAIIRELRRGGQVYYLHNEVKSIEQSANTIQELIPEARVTVAHGQLRERELESVMADFYHKRFNVLVCTTIIETGIDVPSANTIIMDRADKLGLAQLHQLRGRVGRSHHQAYAYLFTPNPKAMSADAIKRLEAIQEANTLGAGFTLASHDLDIRGAGELLGEEQSGHISKIGLTLYMELLDKAVEAIKAGKTPNLDQPFSQGCEINLRTPALIPESYLPDVHLRLLFYKRISNAKSKANLRELKIEMIDRFGLLPEPINTLFQLSELKLLANRVGLSKIEFGPNGGSLDFSDIRQIKPEIIINWVQNQPMEFQLAGSERLRLKIKIEAVHERLNYLEKILQALT